MLLNLLLCLLSSIYYSYAQVNTTEYDGSHIADIIRFPHQVSLRSIYNNIIDVDGCGGSIISAIHILTAGRCVNGKDASEIIAVVGTSFVHLGGKSYKVKQIVVHEDYSEANVVGSIASSYILAQNDIALVLTATKINFNSRVQPILLQSKDVGEGITGTATGWGSTYLEGNATIPEIIEKDVLKEIQLTTITLLACFNRLKSDYTEDRLQVIHICTSMEKGVDICGALTATGVPFVVDGKLTGISTRCVFTVPDVFTSVAAFKPWIDSKMDMTL